MAVALQITFSFSVSCHVLEYGYSSAIAAWYVIDEIFINSKACN